MAWDLDPEAELLPSSGGQGLQALRHAGGLPALAGGPTPLPAF